MEQGANIKFCFKLGKKYAETYELLKKFMVMIIWVIWVYDYTRFTRFKNGRDDLNDDPRPGRPEASNCAELVEKVREIIASDADFTVRMLAEELNWSYCTIYTILTEDLGKRKVSAHFVPHQLNEDQKSQRIFDEKADLYHRPPSVFAWYITVWLFSVPKTENCNEKDFLQWRSNHSSSCNRCYRIFQKSSLKSLWINWLIVPNDVLSLMDPILNKY